MRSNTVISNKAIEQTNTITRDVQCRKKEKKLGHIKLTEFLQTTN
jgi:hypothetical protein